jgi:Na+-translocating ferredoxin:NAD+ oxidoreductase RnfD subunit
MTVQRQWGIVILCLVGMALAVSFIFAFAYPDPFLRLLGGGVFVGCFFVLIGK